jgi:hypothetical protein
VAEKKGNRFCLLVGFSGIVLMPVVNAFLPSAEYLLLTESFAGLIVPAMSMGLFNTMLEVSPVDHRPTYIAVFSAAVNLPVFLAPILATSIAVPLLGVQYALAASSGLRLIALAIMVALVWKRR